eukprot:CAMPEP_0182829048 /NCGR_PEP_ID=MMETSP0006_2-20121128/17805_1 /TAXON_ID=97485 /ORGANISM="Prymnesium parvum, Strain Texoma1" /LENGTH=261 /DNA_ID=CAMNT_0024956465 /DNA_START=160 /DNA_END=942 /DNA_ORIENTATION=-
MGSSHVKHRRRDGSTPMEVPTLIRKPGERTELRMVHLSCHKRRTTSVEVGLMCSASAQHSRTSACSGGGTHRGTSGRKPLARDAVQQADAAEARQLRREGRAAREQLPQDDREGVHVDRGGVLALPHRGGGEHLGRHVLQRADERRHRRDDLLGAAGEPEVADLRGEAARRRVNGQQDVRRLQVAVGDAVAVKILHALGDLWAREMAASKLSAAVRSGAAARAAELRDDVQVRVVRAAAVHLQDRRVPQPREQRRLGAHAG